MIRMSSYQLCKKVLTKAIVTAGTIRLPKRKKKMYQKPDSREVFMQTVMKRVKMQMYPQSFPHLNQFRLRKLPQNSSPLFIPM